MWSDFVSALKAADFQRLNEILGTLDFLELLQNPYVIGILVVVSVIFIIRGMEGALVTFLTIPALLALFQVTVQGSNALDFNAEDMLFFVGGFVALAGVNIYFHFVRRK